MKPIKLVLSILSVALLASCSGGNSSSTSGSTGSSSTSGSSSTGSSTSLDPHKPGSGTIDLYCVNDFHGRVEKEQNGYHYEGGISRLNTYLQQKVALNPSGSVFLNAGDLWQDTYDSSMNKGELLTKAMVEMNCEAMALGNHEFDWGVDQIKANRNIAESSSNETQFTFLGANIYNYSTDKHADELCSSYKVIERGDVRIGIIGAIGEDQLTSITSSNWEDITFKNPVPIVKNLSDKLRNEMECDVVVYLFHGSFNQSGANELSKTSSKSGKPYVDAGFLGHSHQFEYELVNSTPWIQSYQHGAVLGRVTLKVTEGVTECTYMPDYSSAESYKGRYENGYGSGAGSIFASSEDTNVKAIVDSYLTTDFVSKKEEKVLQLQNVSSSQIDKDAGKIQAYATSKYIDKLRESDSSIPNVDLVINNGSRETLDIPGDNKLSRENIFNLIPFTNKTLIASVKGSDIISECISYSNPYYIVSEASLNIVSDQYYTVACIDYLLLHKNTNRQYNYFKSYTETLYEVSKFPYEIVWDYGMEHTTFNMNILSSVAFTGLY